MSDETPSLATAVEARSFKWAHPALAALGLTMHCRRQGTRPYWTGHVYDRPTGRTHAVHLGRDEALTPDHLDERAAALALQICNYLPAWPRHILCPRCGR